MKLTIHGTLNNYHFNPQEDAVQLQGKFNLAFKGKDEQGNPVLIKLLHQHLHNNEEAIHRFVNEYRYRVDHPNIISAIEYVQQHGRHHIIRPWVDGHTLTQRIYRYKPAEVITIILALLEALETLHKQGILHLDVQPKNIIIGTNKQVYLTDLGLASPLTHLPERHPFNVYYSAPEQILNHTHLFNYTTDLYAVGMILFEMLARYKPHQHENPEVLMNLMLAVPIANDGIAEALFNIIQKSASKPRFPLPPTHYSYKELAGLLQQSQLERYPDAASFSVALKNISPATLSTSKWWKFW